MNHVINLKANKHLWCLSIGMIVFISIIFIAVSVIRT